MRISCRAPDWLGDTDLDLFRPYFDSNGGYCVAALEALTTDEIVAILKDNYDGDPQDFMETAEKKAVQSFLENPQTLLMLIKVVKGGQWPENKLELYEQATKSLLTEHNKVRALDRLGRVPEKSLVEAAGAICAVVLISDVDGICLNSSKSTNNYPDYSLVPIENKHAVLAALTRRVFHTVGDETVTYIHRTIAEYFGATWIATAVRQGLPIRRVLSLIGIGGHPAIELRGLHAWLSVTLPEHADELIRSDPYGVLVYGDAASLTHGHRELLLDCLVELSKSDPWFRSSDRQAEPLGSLSGRDMISRFEDILSSRSANYHLKSMVLDAFASYLRFTDSSFFRQKCFVWRKTRRVPSCT